MKDKIAGLRLGSFISFNRAGNYSEGAVKASQENGADVMMIFVGAPQQKRRVPVSELNAKFLKQEWAGEVVVHAPYICNPAAEIDEVIEFNHDFLLKEMERASVVGAKQMILHPGFGKCADALNRISLCIKKLLESGSGFGVNIALETMAGKKGQIGSLEEIAEIIKLCDYHPMIKVCLDTCHLHDYGYDLSHLGEFLDLVENTVSLERITCIHLGDSANVRGSKKDVHANLGFGCVGFNHLINFAWAPEFKGLPIIVETPYWKDPSGKGVSPYKHEIWNIRNKLWRDLPDPELVPRVRVLGSLSNPT